MTVQGPVKEQQPDGMSHRGGGGGQGMAFCGTGAATPRTRHNAPGGAGPPRAQTRTPEGRHTRPPGGLTPIGPRGGGGKCNAGRREGSACRAGPWGQGCIRREGASEAAPEAVGQAVSTAVGGGYCRLQMQLPPGRQ